MTVENLHYYYDTDIKNFLKTTRSLDTTVYCRTEEVYCDTSPPLTLPHVDLSSLSILFYLVLDY